LTPKQNWESNFWNCVYFISFMVFLFSIQTFMKFRSYFISATRNDIICVICIILLFLLLCIVHYYVLIPLFKVFTLSDKNVLYIIPFVIMFCTFLLWFLIIKYLIIKYICLKFAVIPGIFFWEFFKVFNVLRWLGLVYYFSIFRINDDDVLPFLIVIYFAYMYLNIALL